MELEEGDNEKLFIKDIRLKAFQKWMDRNKPEEKKSKDFEEMNVVQ